MNKAFNLKIYSPKGLAYKGEVTEVTLPYIDGEIGIFPNHTSYAAILGTGILSFKTVGGDIERIVVSGGFVRMDKEGLTILADKVSFKEEIDNIESIVSKRRELEEELSGLGVNDINWDMLQAEVKRLSSIEKLVSQ